MTTIRRPILRYHGGKWRLAPWVLDRFPKHRIYVEPFGGAASVLLRKQPSEVEVYNDLNGAVVNVFRVLRSPSASARLAELLRATPCAESEYHLAREPHPDPIEQARRTIVLGHQGHGSTAAGGGKMSGWRRGIRPNSRSVSSREWSVLWDQVGDWADRLRQVYIEQGDAIAVMQRWDQPDAVHYVDPPYLPATRSIHSSQRGYRCEMTHLDHERLCAALRSLCGMVLISGYPSPDYDRWLPGWHRLDRRAMADHGCARVEVLWMNPAALAARYSIATSA